MASIDPKLQLAEEAAKALFKAKAKKTAEELGNTEKQTAGGNDSNASDDTIASKEETKTGFYRPSASKSKNKAKSGKNKGPIALISLVIAVAIIVLSLSLGSIIAPFTFITTVVKDLNTQLAAMDRAASNLTAGQASSKSNSEVDSMTQKGKFKTMTEAAVEKLKMEGIEVDGKVDTNGRIKPSKFIVDGKEMNPKEFTSALKNDSALRLKYKSAYNMEYSGFSDNSFSTWVLKKFGITKNPPELSGETPQERAKALMEKSGAKDIADIKFSDEITDPETGKGTGQYKLEGSNQERTYTKAEVGKMTSSIKVTQFLAHPVVGNTLQAVNILGMTDLACTFTNIIGSASSVAKMATASSLADYSMKIASRVDKMKTEDSSSTEAQALGEFFTGTDNRKMISKVSANDNGDGTVEEISNPNYGKTAMDSDLFRMSASGQTAPTSSISAQYSLGTSLNMFLDTTVKGIAALKYLLTVGTSKTACKVAQSWQARSVGVVLGLGLSILAGPVGIAKAVGMVALIAGAFYGVNALISHYASGSPLSDNMTEKPTERATALWTGLSVITGESAKARGLMPGNTEQIIAYNQLQNQSNLDYIAIKSKSANPFDATNQYSFLGSFIRSVSSYFTSSSNNLASSIQSMSSLVSSSLYSAVSPQSTYATTLDGSRFSGCLDKGYVDIGIKNADVECNIRYIMPTDDLNLGSDEVAQYMEDKNYVEKDTTTGFPAGYKVPDPGEIKTLQSKILEGLASGFVSKNDDKNNEYSAFLDYCAYRALPFGDDSTENSQANAASDDWISGKNCLKTGAPYNYFRMYTLYKTTEDSMNQGDTSTTTQALGLAG